MSRGMSHQKELGGQSRRRQEQGGGAHVQLWPDRHSLPGLPTPALRLTLFPVDQNGAVGPRAAVTLHSVAVGAVIILVPEGAGLHYLFSCTHRQSVVCPDPMPGP
jgi:hypothetical protein